MQKATPGRSTVSFISCAVSSDSSLTMSRIDEIIEEYLVMINKETAFLAVFLLEVIDVTLKISQYQLS